MSVKVQFPGGYIGVVSESAAAVLAKKPGHLLVDEPIAKQDDEPEQPKQPKQPKKRGA